MNWEILLLVLLPLVFIFLPPFFMFVTGALIERSHMKSILRREEHFRSLRTSNLRQIPAGARQAVFLTGSVVLSADGWKTMLAGFRQVFGGRMRSIEPVLERARREALLRLLREAESLGATQVINIRFETANMRSTQGLMVEVVAYGMGIL